MRVIDISRTIESGAMIYPGDRPIELERAADGRPSGVAIPCHCLTHVDAPYHFFNDGARLDELPAERFMLEAVVVEAIGNAIGCESVPPEPAVRDKAVLFKTRHSGPWPVGCRFDEDHAYLTSEAAQALTERGAALVGIDTLSVDRHDDETFPVHRILLGAGVLILEGLDLAAAEPGEYRLAALPLKIARADGAPARAVLMQD